MNEQEQATTEQEQAALHTAVLAKIKEALSESEFAHFKQSLTRLTLLGVSIGVRAAFHEQNDFVKTCAKDEQELTVEELVSLTPILAPLAEISAIGAMENLSQGLKAQEGAANYGPATAAPPAGIQA